MNKKIELGRCPFCNSDNYTRDTDDFQDDFVRMNCHCNDCGKSFVEYFELDEVKFDVEGEEFIYNNTLSKDEKEIILKAMNLLVHAENDSNDYTRIIKVMSGGLNQE